MIRCTIELLPGGDETRRRTIGLVEIANVGGSEAVGNYAVVLTKTPPFAGALKTAWKRGRVTVDGDRVSGLATGEDDEVIAGFVEGHHRTKRGVYDLLYRALKACGLEARCPPLTPLPKASPLSAADPVQQALIGFLVESNAIEGIGRLPLPVEIEAAERLIRQYAVSVPGLNDFQAACAPHKPLREVPGQDVRVGSYVAPPGGPNIRRRLEAIVKRANAGDDPWEVHCRFEMLHPYMDGNGRTGRMLWVWMMRGLGRDPFALPFLHRWYYQTLEHSR